MSKVTVENKKGKITIINRLSYPETVNERVYNAIASGRFEGFLPVLIRQKRKETRIVCVVQGLIPLAQYFSGVVTKKMFLDVVHEIALLIKNCEKNMVNANNMDLQSDKIFVDPQTKSIKCIFWPVVNNQRDNSPHLFLKQLPFELNFAQHESNEYLEEYKSFFCGTNPFSVNSFDMLILKLLGKQISGYSAASSLSGTQSGRMGSNGNKPKTTNNINIEYDPVTAYTGRSKVSAPQREIRRNTEYVNCLSCGETNYFMGNVCVRCGVPLKAKMPIQQPGTYATDYGAAALANNPGKTISPMLISLRTKERYAINKPVFKIGAKQSSCDLVIHNTFISRNHADVIVRGGRYYIVDNNSRNKTFVNGSAVPVGKEVEIFSGTQIRFANEDFIFNLE